MNQKSDIAKSTATEKTGTSQENLKGLRILYLGKEEVVDYVDFAVTPQSLVYLHNAGNKHYLKAVDFISPKEIRVIQRWTVETVMAMDAEWQKYGTMPLELIKAIGTDLCILLETIKEADLVLTKIWNTNNFTHFSIEPTSIKQNNMLEYEIPGYQYTALLNDSLWSNDKNIKVVKNKKFLTNPNYINAWPNQPYWKKIIKHFLGVYRVSRQLKISLFSILFIKLGIKRPPIPSLFLVPNKDTSSLLKYQYSVILNDYLSILPEDPKEIDKLQSELIHSLEGWFNTNTPVMKNIGLYKNIIKEKLTDFISARRNLLSAYIKMQSINSPHPLKMLLPCAIGCGTDAWCSMAIQEKGGVDASGQHGGGHNSYFPYSVFAESRFSFNFTYGDISPTYAFLEKYGKAKLIKSGSPTLYSVHQKCSEYPQKITRILYIMNLCVPFYSANFPWEFVLKQFQVLELLNSYTDKFTIHVKEEHTGTIERRKYAGISFIDDSPKDVMHKYDLLIVESGQSTAVLEATATNKYIVAYTGADWEDLSKESLEMLSERAECFDTLDDFLAGLKKVLDDPQTHLDPSKLSSCDFMNTYSNPVSPESYIETIIKTLELS